MDFLRKIYPSVFQLKAKETKPFVIKVIIFAVLGIVLSAVVALVNYLVGLAGIQALSLIVGFVMYLISLVLGVYFTGGIVLSILKFTGVIKDQNDQQ